MKQLSMIARILTPLAMVVFLAHEISQTLPTESWWYWLMLAGAACTAVGIEIVGILAGHTMEGFWRMGDPGRAVLAFLLLLTYTAVAVYILRGTALVVVPVIAAIVYVLAALTDGLHTAENQQAQDTAVRSRFDLQQEAQDRELERTIRKERELAKISAKYAPQDSQPVATRPHSATLYECACGQVFPKPQSYSAHTRHCEVHKLTAANGHKKEA